MTVVPPLTLKLGSATSTPYKSVDLIEWHNIPPFAVLTGVNGSGKTQFLQALAYRFGKVLIHPPYHDLHAMPFSVEGDSIDVDEFAYLPNAEHSFRVEQLSISNIAQAKHQFLQKIQPGNAQNDIEVQILRGRTRRLFGVDGTHQPTPEEVAKLPDDFLFMLGYADVAAGLSHVFFGYRVRLAELLMEKASAEQVLNEIGRPPWEFVNEALAAAEFNYRVVPPKGKLLTDYIITVEPVGGGLPLQLNDLSSGEKIILRTILWLYNTQHNSVFPKLFLMDEPDAHLHPSMTRQFIDVLKGVLVDKYGVRVILTTHSPSTVALAPEGSVFAMFKEQPRIRPIANAEAIGLLTSGLVIVSPGTRFVLVEDEDDVKFYTMIKEVLAEQGPSRDPMAIKPAPSIVFMPASRRKGEGGERVSGGSSVVRQWVRKFDSPPLDEMFRGIIDRDYANGIPGPRISMLGRYSIENYQLDPMIVFGVLSDERYCGLPNVGVSPGDEHRLRTLCAATLQTIVNYVAQQIEPNLGTLEPTEKNLAAVEFTNGKRLDYPEWMLTRRGHDLLPIYQLVLGQNRITPPKLEKSFRRVRLVPVELAAILSQLQSQ